MTRMVSEGSTTRVGASLRLFCGGDFVRRVDDDDLRPALLRLVNHLRQTRVMLVADDRRVVGVRRAGTDRVSLPRRKIARRKPACFRRAAARSPGRCKSGRH